MCEQEVSKTNGYWTESEITISNPQFVNLE